MGLWSKLIGGGGGDTGAQLEAPKGAPATRRLTSEQAVERLAERITSLPDPDEVLLALGVPRCELRRLLTDDEIDGALEVRRDAVLATPWRLEGDDEALAEWVRAEIEPHMEDLVRGAWSAIPFGYSVIELIYRESEDGQLHLARAADKPMEWFDITRDGRLLFNEAGKVTGEARRLDTAYKFILTRNQPTYRNPYGEALLSRLYWPWVFRRSSWDYWIQYLERFGQPLPVGKGRDPAELVAALSRVAQDSAIAVSHDDEVDLVQAQGEGSAFEKMEDAIVRRMQRRILGQTLTTGTDDAGSRALGEVHERVAATKRNADLRLVQDSVQRVIRALVWLNFPEREPPRVVFGDEQGLEEGRAERDKTLHDLGVRFTEAYIKRAYGLEAEEFTVTDPDEGDTGGRESAGGAFEAGPGQPAGPGRRAAGVRLQDGAASGARFTPGVEASERLVEQALQAAGSPIPPETIRAEVEAADGEDDLYERLAGYVAEDADDGTHRETLERLAFAAMLLGWEAEDQQADLDDED